MPALIDRILSGKGAGSAKDAPAKRKPGRKPSGKDHVAANRERMRESRAAGSDIDPATLVCVDPERRARCERDLVLYCQTYLKHIFYLEFSPKHVEILRDLEKRIFYGGRQCLAAERGFGKDMMIVAAALWGSCYGHVEFFVMSCYKMSVSNDRINHVRREFENNPLLLDDFPLICAPIRALERKTQRARGQKVGGINCRMEWGSILVLPTVKGSPASGTIIHPASIKTSVRGLNYNGVRPDFVGISDPSTRDISRSAEQSKKVFSTMNADFGGLGGPGRTLGIFGAVTIIAKGDPADQLTDVELHPEWRGKRYKAFENWPDDFVADDGNGLWLKYYDMLADEAKPGSGPRKSSQFYLSNRAEMDKGALVSWETNFISDPHEDGKPLENSAIEHYMRKRWENGEEDFNTEYQNTPPVDPSESLLTRKSIASSLFLTPRYVAPEGFTDRIVQGIDIKNDEMHHIVFACALDGSAVIIDYDFVSINRVPGQDYRFLTEGGQRAFEELLIGALEHRKGLCDPSSGVYTDYEGNPITVDMTLIDSSWPPSQKPVYRFCKQSGDRWRPGKGGQQQIGNTKYSQPPPTNKHTKRKGIMCHGSFQLEDRVWLWHFNADYWKLHVLERFTQDVGTKGAWAFFGETFSRHMQFAGHILAEQYLIDEKKFKKRKADNHYFDCCSMGAAAGSMVGVRLGGHKRPAAKRSKSRPAREGGHKTPDGRSFVSK